VHHDYTCPVRSNQATEQPALFGACPKPGKIGRVVAEKQSAYKRVDNGGGGTGVVSHPDGLDCYHPLHHKIQRWRAIMEEVGKECSKFSITGGTGDH